MQYFYAGLWFLVGLMLIFSFSKENKVFIPAGIFFLFLGGWWLANALLPEVDLFAGGYGIALRVISLVALGGLGFVFVKEYRKGEKAAKESKKAGKGKEE